MADALCGPSNPLQNLQKHTQIDRTLQQDRLVGPRQSPAQGFRTADPRAGSIDADFHAFETAAPGPFQFQQPEFPNTLPAFHPQTHAAPGGWAADFQKLNINEQPLPAGQFRAEAPLVRSTVGGWQNDFMRQRSSASPSVVQGKQAMRDPQMNMNMYSNQGQPSMMYSQQMYQSYGGLQQEQQLQQPQPLSGEQHAEMFNADFEIAFAEAFSHAEQMHAAQLQDQPPSLETQEPREIISIGSDAIHYRMQSERTVEQDTRDADELARTAGQLLTSVQHDTSEKFQNSQFLELMRRIRDREVEVQNNDLQHTGTGMAASATNMEPQTAETYRHKHTERTEEHLQNQDASHFEFPDMDAVYAPTNTAADAGVEESPTSARNRFPGSWDYPPTSQSQRQMQPPYTTYGFDDDQYPASQTEALHPGGKWYPDQSPQLRRPQMEVEHSMSGAVPPVDLEGVGASGNGIVEDGVMLEKRISASDFEYVDESAGLARRFVRGEMGV